MELGLFSSHSSSSAGSDAILSNLVPNSIHRLKFKHQIRSCRGSVATRASHSSMSGDVASAVNDQDLLHSISYQIPTTAGPTTPLVFKTPKILDAFDDEYGGVVVNPSTLPSNPSIFTSVLRSSIFQWKMKGKKGVWLKLPLERAELVPVAVQEGFEYHHAEKTFVMMTYWIPDGPCLLPPNASHHVGVGSFVINDEDEVLVVQEKHCVPSLLGLWKIPTGFILETEEISTGAVREVKEETGIDSKFVEVVAFRHVRNVSFDKSDLFFICILRPASAEITIDDLEIRAAKWMPLEEFVKQPLVQEDGMFKKIVEICMARLGQRYCGLSVHRVFSRFDGRVSSLYFNMVEDVGSNCPAT